VFCGVAGVQPQSETVWRQAKRYRVPCIAFVNKMDRSGARFAWVVEQLRERLAAPAVAVQIPWGSEASFRGVVDLVAMRARVFDATSQGAQVSDAPVPEELAAAAEEARAKLVEALAEKDETLLAAYLENADVPADALRASLRRLTVSGQIVPVLCGSSLHNQGIQPLLDAVVDYLPSPLDVPDVQGHHPKTEEPVVREASDFAPLSALAFKIANDPYVGKLIYVRVYSGVLRKGQNAFNPRTRRRERLARILRMHANHREDAECLHAGEIGAVPGLRNVTTGDTLCAENQPVVLERISFPEPVIAMAVEPKTQADREKLVETLATLAEEDPTFKVSTNPDTGQTIISGMGELHLEILKDRMFREFKVAANAGKPTVAYRETIRGTGSADHVFQREIGGHGHFGRVALSVRPLERGAGIRVALAAKSDQIPADFHEAVEAGIRDGLVTGVVGNYPLIDIEVTVTGGACHPVDSSEIAFRSASIMALREAVAAAQPALLEPLMKVEVITPEAHLGDVIGDINGRRGRVTEIKPEAAAQTVHAEIPLAELFGYSTGLRSLTRGRASYSMEPCRFEVVPENLQAAILNR